MCTLTWQFNDDAEGYSLFFNRDELKTRKRALLPSMHQTANGVSYLAPIDADAGGTWLAVNQFGLTICLLNNYLASEPEDIPLSSRGEIVVALAGCDSLQAAEAMLGAMDLTAYRGFDVVLVQHDAIQLSWDRYTLVRFAPKLPVTSSSYHSQQVCQTRQDYFRSLSLESLSSLERLDALEQFHRCHINDDLSTMSDTPVHADSVCMHRDNATTVSQCFVQVSSGQVSIAYSDGAPCVTPAGAAQVLQRRVAA